MKREDVEGVRKYIGLMCLLIGLGFPSSIYASDIPDYVQFDEATHLYYEVVDNRVTILGWDLTPFEDGVLTIPAMIEGVPVTSIGYDAFGFAIRDGEVIHPFYASWGYSDEAITKGRQALSSVERIVLPDTLRRIDGRAFASMWSDEYPQWVIPDRFTLPDSVDHIGYAAFRGLAFQGGVTFTQPNVTIGDLAFADGALHVTHDSTLFERLMFVSSGEVQPDSIARSFNATWEVKEGANVTASESFHRLSGASVLEVSDRSTITWVASEDIVNKLTPLVKRAPRTGLLMLSFFIVIGIGTVCLLILRHRKRQPREVVRNKPTTTVSPPIRSTRRSTRKTPKP